MKYRVERERRDTGYGPGWIILNPEGLVISDPFTHWTTALDVALGITYLVGHAT